MAGRGRGGSGLSLTQEQLAALGVARGESAAPQLAPPPLFPKLEGKPLPLPSDAATDYMLLVKQQFAEQLLESAAYVRARAARPDVERYSDKYRALAGGAGAGPGAARALACAWAHLPAELRPAHARAARPPAGSRKRKLAGETELAERLQSLENKELKEEGSEETEGGADRTGAAGAPDDDDEEVEEEQEYEADDGTDYANNYFDNGEDLDEDEDNLDDGPIY